MTAAHRHARLSIPGLADQAPSLAPDIYPDLVVKLWGRMPRPAEGSTVEVVCDDGTLVTVPVVIGDDCSITTRWAGARIKALDADVMAAEAGEDEAVADLEKQIVELSIAHSVLSKYTAWLAVDRTRTTDTVIVRTIVQPHVSNDLLSFASMAPGRIMSAACHMSIPISTGMDFDDPFDDPFESGPSHDADFDELIERLEHLIESLTDDPPTDLDEIRTVIGALLVDLRVAITGSLEIADAAPLLDVTAKVEAILASDPAGFDAAELTTLLEELVGVLLDLT